MRPVTFLFSALLAAPALGQPVLYVRTGAIGAGDGSSWVDAFPELQSALAAAVPPIEVWVAAGTYRPTSGANREATFRLISGVALYGGFDGTEAARSERDWEANETVLSGEIGEADELDDNACHVVTGSGSDSTAVLDGFAVTAGYGAGVNPSCADPFGGGLLAVAGRPTVRHVRFHGNHAVGGGGVYNRFGSDGVFVDCLFESNSANSGGGGMVNEGSSPRLSRVRFRSNQAQTAGALLNWRGAHPVCMDCVFEENEGHVGGGAVYNELSAPLFVGSTFTGNRCVNGGGAVRTEDDGDVVCLWCTFRDNVSENGVGGAVYIRDSRPTFINTLFEGNEADGARGGAVASETESEPLFVNVVFVGNEARSGGAALFLTGTPRLVNVTLAGNRGLTGGAAVEVNGGAVTVLNAVVWGNTLYGNVPSGVLVTSGSFDMHSGLLEGGCEPPLVCEAVADADPAFVRSPVWNGSTFLDAGDLRLRAGSPGLDAGSVAWLPADAWDLDGDGDTDEPLPVDLAGTPRVEGLSVDLGAYEGAVVVAQEPEPDGAGEGLSVAPNPVHGQATIRLALETGAHVRVTLYDVLGRELAVIHEGPLSAGATSLGFDASVLQPGLYVVRATRNGDPLVRTVTVLR